MELDGRAKICDMFRLNMREYELRTQARILFLARFIQIRDDLVQTGALMKDSWGGN
jgi:hypothetical protein